ncbi:hypothetical protein E2C01_019968 [Portunus trituberculatus]|uniref:Uncharacterized protein n=1 Tax=Portunus trituberculatus TaxID=210409 RepID=A0A5B7E017_PORTR|nr:hypothetical protein [Portunus trituberculatus]
MLAEVEDGEHRRNVNKALIFYRTLPHLANKRLVRRRRRVSSLELAVMLKVNLKDACGRVCDAAGLLHSAAHVAQHLFQHILNLQEKVWTGVREQANDHGNSLFCSRDEVNSCPHMAALCSPQCQLLRTLYWQLQRFL